MCCKFENWNCELKIWKLKFQHLWNYSSCFYSKLSYINNVLNSYVFLSKTYFIYICNVKNILNIILAIFILNCLTSTVYCICMSFFQRHISCIMLHSGYIIYVDTFYISNVYRVLSNMLQCVLNFGVMIFVSEPESFVLVLFLLFLALWPNHL